MRIMWIFFFMISGGCNGLKPNRTEFTHVHSRYRFTHITSQRTDVTTNFNHAEINSLQP